MDGADQIGAGFWPAATARERAAAAHRRSDGARAL